MSIRTISENEKSYLTSSIFSYNHKLYYHDEEKNKYIKINIKNWHKYLNDYGWEKLEYGWKKRLKNNSKMNFRFGVLDCGGNGNCLFNCITEALNNPINPLENEYDSNIIRKIAADQINKDNFPVIIESYKLAKESGEFQGDWDPSKIESISQLQNEIKKDGDSCWGDHIIIQLLQEKIKINFILLKSDIMFSLFKGLYKNIPITEKYKIQSLGQNINKYEKYMILHYISGLHFQLVGYFNGINMQTIFKRENLPSEIIETYYTDCKEKIAI